MKAAILVGPEKSKVIEATKPEITETEVLIRVKVCGVCASELHGWIKGTDANRQLTLGHEAMGVIEEVGSHVTGFKVGDRVTGLIYRGFAEYTTADYRSLVHVPDELNDIESIGEPLSCLVSGANRTPVALGDTVAIVGLGFMGLGFLQLMKLKGTGKIIAVDVRQESLDNARRFGADVTCFPAEVGPQDKVLTWDQIGQGIDVVVEATGTQAGLNLAGEMAATHGTLSIVGYHQSNNGMREVPMEFWNWKALTVINAHERRQEVHLAAMTSVLSLIKTGKFNMKDLITNVFSLDEVDKAYEAIKTKPLGFIKGVIRIS